MKISISPVGFPRQAAWNGDVFIEVNTRRGMDGAQGVCFRHQPQVSRRKPSSTKASGLTPTLGRVSKLDRLVSTTGRENRCRNEQYLALNMFALKIYIPLVGLRG